VRFWDSSAVVPLLVPEGPSDRLKHLYDGDPAVLAWWGTEVECVSAIVRRQRVGRLSPAVAATGLERLRALRAAWSEVEPREEVREVAKRFLRVHDLRAADALQLAAAFFAAESRPPTLGFVCLDDRLLGAAHREGFVTIGPGASPSSG
jgi:predicted nucleic acid-binding protein